MSNNGNGQPHKRGPKPKVDEVAQKQVFAILASGGSLTDAADVLGVNRATITNKLNSDPQFSQGVDRAVAKGKLRLVNKIKKAKPWQAAAWMLERKWGSEYGKRDAVIVSGNLNHNHEHAIVQNAITDPATVRLAEALNARMAHDACGNGELPSSN